MGNRRINYYHLYDLIEKKYVLRDATSRKIREHLCDDNIQCAAKADSRTLYHKRYLICASTDDCREWIKLDGTIKRIPGASKCDIRPLLCEWDKVCHPFRQVEWVKKWEPGVRILGR